MNSDLDQAGALIAAGRYDQALKLLTGSDLPGRHALLGRAYLGRRHGLPALRQLRAALAHDPGDAGSILNLARAHLTLLDPGAAIPLLEALRARTDLPGLGETLVSAYRRDARHEDALALAEDLPSPTPSLLYERALTLLNLGRAEAALDGFDRLLAEAPDHAAGWFWSHAAALDLFGWDDAERRLLSAAACPGANRKYQGFIAAYDLLLGAKTPRPCPTPYRHLTDAAQAMLPKCRDMHLIGVHAAMLRWSLAQARNPGLLCEFGVRRGTSIRVLAAETGETVHGFDSFAGLPEPWVKAPAGVLTTGGDLPDVPANVTLHAGWFEESLPPFLAAHSGHCGSPMSIAISIHRAAPCSGRWPTAFGPAPSFYSTNWSAIAAGARMNIKRCPNMWSISAQTGKYWRSTCRANRFASESSSEYLQEGGPCFRVEEIRGRSGRRATLKMNDKNFSDALSQLLCGLAPYSGESKGHYEKEIASLLSGEYLANSLSREEKIACFINNNIFLCSITSNSGLRELSLGSSIIFQKTIRDNIFSVEISVTKQP